MYEAAGTLRASALELEPMVSYAGNQEDVRLRRIVSLLPSTVYVDVGAGDAVEGSVTYWLYTQGWRGALVEPGARGEELSRIRPDDLVIPAVVGAGSGEVVLYETSPDAGMSTVVPERLPEVLALGQTVRETRRPVLSLTEVFERAPGEVSVLSVDVEGAEGEVLGSLDWERYRPVVVVVEAIRPWRAVSTREDFEHHLHAAGYLDAAFDGVNIWYVDGRLEAAQELSQALSYPVSVLDSWESRASVLAREASVRDAQAAALEIAGLSAEMAAVGEERDRLADDMAALREERDRLADDVGRYRGELANLRRLRRDVAGRLSAERQRAEDLQSRLDEAENALLRARDAERRVAAELGEVLHSKTWRFGAPVAHAVATPVRRLSRARNVRPVLGGARRELLHRVERIRLNRTGPEGRAALAVGKHTHPAFLRSPSELGAAPPEGGSWRALAASAARDDDDTLQDRVNRSEELRDPAERAVLLAAVAEGVAARGSKTPGRRTHNRATVVLDARSLQDASLALRGVGQYARELLRSLLDLGADITLFIDPELPALVGEPAGVEQVSTISHHLEQRTSWLVQPSPMTHDQWPLTALLDNAQVWCTTVVYDFIPSRFPDVYLPEPAARVRHAARAQALGLYDEALAISQVTLAELERIVGPPATSTIAWPSLEHPSPAVVTTAGAPALPDRYVLISAGREHRKNIVGALGMVALLQQQDPSVEAVILGWSGPPTEVIGWAQDAGLRDGTSHVLPFLADADATEVRRRALLCVVPSFAEGLSLPIIEALRDDCPVVASAIPPHKELLGPGPWLADPAQPASLKEAAGAVLRERSSTLRDQRAALTAHPHVTVKSAMQHRHQALAQAPAADAQRSRQPGARPRLAIITPWPPQRSGVADYSRSTLLPLREHVDLTLGLSPGARPDADVAPLVRRASLAELDLASQDELLVVLGNSHFHLPGLEVLEARGGVALCHDVRHTELNSYLGLQDPPLGEAAGRRHQRTLRHELDALPTLGFAHVAKHARLLIFHSAQAAERVGRETGAATASLPFVPYRTPTPGQTNPEARLRARSRLGMADGDVHLALLGGVDVRTKAADVVVEAVAWLRQWGHAVVLHVAGAVSPLEQGSLQDVANGAGVGPYLRWHGHVSETAYSELLVASDIGVQLRSAALLALSGAAADLAAFGIPSVATQAIVEEMGLPPFIRPVPDDFSPLIVAEALEALIKDPADARDAEEQRQVYLQSHGVAEYGNELIRLLGMHA